MYFTDDTLAHTDGSPCLPVGTVQNVDSGLDWTLDWIMDSIMDSIMGLIYSLSAADILDIERQLLIDD